MDINSYHGTFLDNSATTLDNTLESTTLHKLSTSPTDINLLDYSVPTLQNSAKLLPDNSTPALDKSANIHA